MNPLGPKEIERIQFFSIDELKKVEAVKTVVDDVEKPVVAQKIEEEKKEIVPTVVEELQPQDLTQPSYWKKEWADLVNDAEMQRWGFIKNKEGKYTGTYSPDILASIARQKHKQVYKHIIKRIKNGEISAKNFAEALGEPGKTIGKVVKGVAGVGEQATSELVQLGKIPVLKDLWSKPGLGDYTKDIPFSTEVGFWYGTYGVSTFFASEVLSGVSGIICTIVDYIWLKEGIDHLSNMITYLENEKGLDPAWKNDVVPKLKMRVTELNKQMMAKTANLIIEGIGGVLRLGLSGSLFISKVMTLIAMSKGVEIPAKVAPDWVASGFLIAFKAWAVVQAGVDIAAVELAAAWDKNLKLSAQEQKKLEEYIKEVKEGEKAEQKKLPKKAGFKLLDREKVKLRRFVSRFTAFEAVVGLLLSIPGLVITILLITSSASLPLTIIGLVLFGLGVLLMAGGLLVHVALNPRSEWEKMKRYLCPARLAKVTTPYNKVITFINYIDKQRVKRVGPGWYDFVTKESKNEMKKLLGKKVRIDENTQKTLKKELDRVKGKIKKVVRGPWIQERMKEVEKTEKYIEENYQKHIRDKSCKDFLGFVSWFGSQYAKKMLKKVREGKKSDFDIIDALVEDLGSDNKDAQGVRKFFQKMHISVEDLEARKKAMKKRFSTRFDNAQEALAKMLTTKSWEQIV